MHGLVTDESFDLEKTSEYILSIQMSLGGFSFSVIHPGENRLLALQDTRVTISSERFITRRFNEWLDSERLLQQTYSDTRLIIASEKFTLIPESLYNPQQKRTIIQPVLETDATENIFDNIIEDYEIRLLFALPQHFQHILNNASVFHPIKLLTEKRPAINEGNGLILWFNSGGCYFILYRENELMLANHFKITHENDVIYYVLTTLKQLEVAPGKTKLFMAGETAEHESMQQLLHKYFTSATFLHPESEYQIDRERFDQPLHPFIQLFI